MDRHFCVAVRILTSVDLPVLCNLNPEPSKKDEREINVMYLFLVRIKGSAFEKLSLSHNSYDTAMRRTDIKRGYDAF